MSFEQSPMSMQPMGDAYQSASGSRPGVLKGVGVASVVVGLIGLGTILVGCLIATVIGVAAMGGNGGRGSSSTPNPGPGYVAPNPFPSAALPGVNVPAPEISGDGLSVATSEAVASAMQKGRLLTEEQRRSLVALLRKTGKTIFPGGAGALTPEAVHGNVSECGSVAGEGSSAEGLYFIVGSGRVETFDDHASFRADGASDVVSVHVDDPAVVLPTTATASGVRPSRGVRVPVRNVTVVTHINLTIMMLDYLGGILMSGLLRVAGILLLRNVQSAITMHWVYVWIKIPLVALAAASNWYFLRGYAQLSSTGSIVGPGSAPLAVVGVIFMALLGLTYPFVLIVVLRSDRVRAYRG